MTGSRSRAAWAVSSCCNAKVVSKVGVVFSRRVRTEGTIGRAVEEAVSTDGDPWPVCDRCGLYQDGPRLKDGGR